MAAWGISGSEIYMPSLLLKPQRVEPRGSNLSRILAPYAPWLVFVKVNLHFTQAGRAPFSGFANSSPQNKARVLLAAATMGHGESPNPNPHPHAGSAGSAISALRMSSRNKKKKTRKEILFKADGDVKIAPRQWKDTCGLRSISMSRCINGPPRQAEHGSIRLPCGLIKCLELLLVSRDRRLSLDRLAVNHRSAV